MLPSRVVPTAAIRFALERCQNVVVGVVVAHSHGHGEHTNDA